MEAIYSELDDRVDCDRSVNTPATALIFLRPSVDVPTQGAICKSPGPYEVSLDHVKVRLGAAKRLIASDNPSITHFDQPRRTLEGTSDASAISMMMRYIPATLCLPWQRYNLTERWYYLCFIDVCLLVTSPPQVE